MNKTELFLKFKKDIENISKKYSHKTNMEFDDLVAEGNLFFCECLEKFDQSRGEFENYFRRSLSGFYKDLTEKENRRETILEPEIIELFPDQDRENFDLIVSEKTEKVLKAIFNPKVDFLKFELQNHRKISSRRTAEIKKAPLTQKMIFKYFVSEGWKAQEVYNCFYEIKNAI